MKVEEYNLNVDQFVHVLMTELRAPAAEMILSYEVSPQYTYTTNVEFNGE